MTTTHTPLDAFKIGLNAGKLPFFSKSGIEHLRRITVGMTEFRFDEATSHALGHLSMGGLEHLGPLLPDIRLPMKTCAISFNVTAAHAGTTDGSTFSDEGRGVFKDGDTFNGEICTMIASSQTEFPIIDFFFVDMDKDRRNAMIFPLIYRLDVERPRMMPIFWGNLELRSNAFDKPNSVTARAYQRFAGTVFNNDPDQALLCTATSYLLLGSAIAQIDRSRASVATLTDIMCKTGLFITPDFDRKWSKDGIAAGSVLYAGFARLAITALAMLSMRDVEVLEIDAPKRKPGMIRVGNRSAPYWQHSSVRLTVPSVRYLYLVKRHAQKILRRRHHVIGHWVNRGGDRSCQHTWSDIDLNHKKCTTCGRNRHWRKDFDRGDASLGWVQHDRYNVVSPHKQDTLLEQVNVVLSHR